MCEIRSYTFDTSWQWICFPVCHQLNEFMTFNRECLSYVLMSYKSNPYWFILRSAHIMKKTRTTTNSENNLVLVGFIAITLSSNEYCRNIRTRWFFFIIFLTHFILLNSNNMHSFVLWMCACLRTHTRRTHTHTHESNKHVPCKSGSWAISICVCVLYTFILLRARALSRICKRMIVFAWCCCFNTFANFDISFSVFLCCPSLCLFSLFAIRLGTHARAYYTHTQSCVRLWYVVLDRMTACCSMPFRCHRRIHCETWLRLCDCSTTLANALQFARASMHMALLSQLLLYALIDPKRMFGL